MVCHIFLSGLRLWMQPVNIVVDNKNIYPFLDGIDIFRYGLDMSTRVDSSAPICSNCTSYTHLQSGSWWLVLVPGLQFHFRGSKGLWFAVNPVDLQQMQNSDNNNNNNNWGDAALLYRDAPVPCVCCVETRCRVEEVGNITPGHCVDTVQTIGTLEHPRADNV